MIDQLCRGRQARGDAAMVSIDSKDAMDGMDLEGDLTPCVGTV